MLAEFITKHRLPESFAETAEQWLIPLANNLHRQYLLTKEQGEKTLFVGINGCQGSGKSTLVDFLASYLAKAYQQNVINLSLDDFYLSQAERKHLADTIHPLFLTRGVPGTHDTHLIKNVLSNIKQGIAVKYPRFDKKIDNPVAEAKWPTAQPVIDIVLLEGWCWGVSSQSPDELIPACNALEARNDPQNIWRKTVNTKLKNDYQPLYDMMNYWVMLKAPSFDTVFNWRWQQEEKLRDSIADDLISNNETPLAVMNKQQVKLFIQYFQRLTEHGLKTLPQQCDQVFKLDENRKIISRTLNRVVNK